MGQTNWVHLDDCDVLAVTEAAVLVRFDGGEHWLPKSQLDEPDRYEKGDKGITVTCSEWIARQKGIEVEG